MNSGPIAYFVQNPIAAKLLMIILILGGILAGFQLPIRSLPEIDLRTIVVTVNSPNSSPREIEEDINRRVEESLIGLVGVARVVSVASDGMGRIEVELDDFADAEAVVADVSNAIDSIENFPPATAESPEIEHAKLSYQVQTLAVSSEFLSESALRSTAEDIYNELLALPGVSHVRLRGVRDREIAIEMNEEELRRHNISFRDVARTVRLASINLSFGQLQTEAGDVMLHVVAKKEYGRDFEDIPLITRSDGTIVKLGDVARVRDAFVDDNVLTEIDGRSAVLVRVEVAESHSFTRTAGAIKNWLANYQPPPTVVVSIWDDHAAPISDRFSEILQNALIGVVLVFICLVLVFDLRVAVWVTAGIPLSFVGSLMLFGLADLTLNMGTVLAFFVLVGIVVDDAVVVGESIATERERGKRGWEAAVSGARAVAGPITVGALTTALAFVPLLFISEANYQILQVFFFVTLFVLLISLFEALCILPAHLSHERRWSLAPLRTIQDTVSARLDRFRDAIVVPLVSWSVRHEFLTFAFGALFVAFAIWLVRSDNVRVVVFDSAASVSDTIHVDLRLPIGTSFDASAAATERFVAAAQSINEQLAGTSIRSIGVKVGEFSDTAASRTGKTEPIRNNHASVTLKLHDRPVRQESPEAIERAWRQNVGSTSDLEEVSFQSSRFRFKPSVAYALIHDDPEILQQAANDLKSFMGTMPGLYALSDSLSPGKRHFEVELTKAGEAAGLTPAMVGKQLRASFPGLEVQRIQRGHEEIKVVVRYPAERRQSLRDLATERIHLPGGKEIPLSTAALITEETEAAERTRIDGRRAALIHARADLIVTTPIKARRMIANNFLPDLQARYPGLAVSRDAGAWDERTMLRTLGVMVPLVLILMYGLMASFLRSYWKPFVAVIGIPVAAAGGVLGHWVLGWHVTAISIFGMVAVSGVIVNDALVLLDRYNRIRQEREAIPAIAAASAATRDRFRAVFLTSLTTVLGLSPLLYERSDELLFLVPFVVSMLGGLIAATAFTILALPALVMIVEGRREI